MHVQYTTVVWGQLVKLCLLHHILRAAEEIWTNMYRLSKLSASRANEKVLKLILLAYTPVVGIYAVIYLCTTITYLYIRALKHVQSL